MKHSTHKCETTVQCLKQFLFCFKRVIKYLLDVTTLRQDWCCHIPYFAANGKQTSHFSNHKLTNVINQAKGLTGRTEPFVHVGVWRSNSGVRTEMESRKLTS